MPNPLFLSCSTRRTSEKSPKRNPEERHFRQTRGGGLHRDTEPEQEEDVRKRRGTTVPISPRGKVRGRRRDKADRPCQSFGYIKVNADTAAPREELTYGSQLDCTSNPPNPS
ncbi:hypothetical protein U0070_025344 [Myodes glareolus]|uniref:Uncharacterized protein n=1 Tax=Myodes glareolus TaxID=447135 RepID=A0AAW0JMG7_MYOGA